MHALTVQPESLADRFQEMCARLERLEFAEGLWDRRLDLWTSDTSAQRSIASRLGWLDALDFVGPHLPRLKTFAESVKTDGFTDIVLLGMGGSSLAPEVIRQVIGVAPGFPRFRMLDSVDPEAVRAAMADAATTLFVLASKSGSTIEPNVMAAEAQRRVRAAHASGWGPRAVAITDEHTPFHRRAVEQQFRDVFVNPADIGGRYSALSFFGMVPAALMGIDLDALIASGREMEAACRHRSIADNPGLSLGAFMAAGAAGGRDKLTLLLPSRLQPFGLWVEQLVAESTGKHGSGVVPITGEPSDARFGADRVAVAIVMGDDAPDQALLERARAERLPLATLRMRDTHALGAEFFRWEVATAAAGALLGINPFDEPNVQQAKDATRALLETYRTEKRLPVPEPHASTGGIRLALSSAAQTALVGGAATDFLKLIRGGDYFALLAYLPPDDPEWARALGDLRTSVARAAGCASMLGYGPRYLHSTGQLHKGGANNGVFVVVTAEVSEDLPIPGEPFSFGVLEMAQAVGDFQSLDRERRRAMLVQLPRRVPGLLASLTDELTSPAARAAQ